jgi:transposase
MAETIKLIKYVIGIDISKDTFEACFGSIDIEQKTKLSASKSFKNSDQGFEVLLNWVKQVTKEDIPIWFVMEATGVYFENLAYFLAEQKQNINVILPTKTKHFKMSTSTKTKNDKIDARTLTLLGLERQLDPWNMPAENMRTIKELSREHESLKDMATQIKNQLHAKRSSHKPNMTTIERLEKHLSFLEQHQDDIVKELKAMIKSQPEIDQKISLIEQSLKGVGFMTLLKIIAETNGFAFIANAKQLTSYAGLDIVENQSGIKQGATSISSKGNSHLRKALYMPALSVIRYVDTYKSMYIRLCENNKPKKKGITAIMRKLLTLIYSLWKNNQPFNPNYLKELNFEKST